MQGFLNWNSCKDGLEMDFVMTKYDFRNVTIYVDILDEYEF